MFAHHTVCRAGGAPRMLDRSGAKSRAWPVTAVWGGQKPSEDVGQQHWTTLPTQLLMGTHRHDKRCCWWQQLQVPDLSGPRGAHPLCSFPHPQPFPGLHSPWHDASEPAARPIPVLLCAHGWHSSQPCSCTQMPMGRPERSTRLRFPAEACEQLPDDK